MQLCVVFAILAVAAEAAVLKRIDDSAHNTQHHLVQRRTAPENAVEVIHYGDTRCPCIGFDNIEGSTLVTLEFDNGEKVFNKTVEYPADLGARCEAWDQDRNPACIHKNERPGWCEQRWCLVDPCDCNIEILPKPSVYIPQATYIGKPLFFSYATCGGRDFWTDPDIIPEVGKPKCRCIGFNGMPGSTEVNFEDGKVGLYPGDVGGSCKAWDHAHHPSCKGKGEDAPAWCKANWCYVDPCGCELPKGAVPKISAYLPEATFTGKNLYYSYETCHSPDTWTKKHNKQACVNQETKADCDKNHRCAWTGDRCLGTELVNHPLCVDEEEVKANDEKSGASAVAAWSGTCLAAVTTAVLAHS